jgi:hypothetical protein
MARPLAKPAAAPPEDACERLLPLNAPAVFKEAPQDGGLLTVIRMRTGVHPLVVLAAR